MTKLAMWIAVLAASAMQAPARTALSQLVDGISRGDQGTDVFASPYFVETPRLSQVATAPAGWITLVDRGADPRARVAFETMPPGWHITTGPGAVVYDPTRTCEKSCRIEAEFHLFPGSSEGGYGVVLGFRPDEASGLNYDTFLLRRDGAHSKASWIRGTRNPQLEWRPQGDHDVVRGLPDKPVKNVITIDVDAGDDEWVAQFLVNGHRVYREQGLTPPFRQRYAGVVGLRVDADVSVHVSRLEVTAK